MDGTIDKAMSKAQAVLAEDFQALRAILSEILAAQLETNRLLGELNSKTGPQ